MISINEILPIRFYQYFDGLSFQAQKDKESGNVLPNYWEVDTAINLQFEFTDANYLVKLYMLNEDDTETLLATSSDATPATWATTYIHTVSYTPDEEKVYKFFLRFYDTTDLIKTLWADCLNVKYKLTDYIKVNWYNSENKDGIVYNLDSGTFTMTTFVRGKMDTASTSGEFETMTNADGQLSLLKTTQQKAYLLKGWLLSNYQAVQLSLVSGCDRVTIDNNQVLFDKPIAIAPIDNEIINEVEGTALSYDWDKVNEYEADDFTVTYRNFATVTLTNTAYFINFYANRNFKYSVNGSSYIYVSNPSANVQLLAPPNSEINIYASLDVGAVYRFSSNIEYAVIHDLGSIIDIGGMLNFLTDLKEVDFIADTSLVTGMGNLFSYDDSLEKITGLTFESAINLYGICDGCSSLTEFNIFTTPYITIMTRAFADCTSLLNVRGHLDTTTVTNKSDIFDNTPSLLYPSAAFAPTFETGKDWWHPLDCDITVEVLDAGDEISVVLDTSTIDIYTDSIAWESTSGFAPVIDSGTNVLIGLNINIGVSELNFDKNYNNIKEIVVNTLRNITTIDSFVNNLTTIEKITVKCDLPLVVSAEYAFYKSSCANYMNVPNLVNGYQMYGYCKTTMCSIITTTDLDNAGKMFAESNIIDIRGVLDTTAATSTADMFTGVTQMEHPTVSEINSLQYIGYLYEY